MKDDPRLVLEMFSEVATDKASKQAIEIPAKEINDAIQLIKAQAQAIKQYEEVSDTQASRIKFKLLRELETNLDAGMLETEEMMKFFSMMMKTEDPDKHKKKGGLAEHLEEMYSDATKVIAADTIEKARKYVELEKNVIDVEEVKKNTLPNI